MDGDTIFLLAVIWSAFGWFARDAVTWLSERESIRRRLQSELAYHELKRKLTDGN